ncbi:hypothetical protein BD560DRAFT_442346 [Blakeslea trispora]|nr:hypothetical protein BD560DRAFT_442346 [Blakeslea trispora]
MKIWSLSLTVNFRNTVEEAKYEDSDNQDKENDQNKGENQVEKDDDQDSEDSESFHDAISVVSSTEAHIIEILSDSSSDNEEVNKSTATSPMLTSASSVNNEQVSLDLSDERIDISDFIRDTEIQDASSTSDMEQDNQITNTDSNNVQSTTSSQPVINITGSNNQVILVQGQEQVIALLPSTTYISPPTSSPSVVPSVHEIPSSTVTTSSEVPVEVTDITPSNTTPPVQDLSLTHSSPLLITMPPALTASDLDPPPPQSTASCPPESSVVVQRRTRNQGGDNVMVTNSSYLSNEVNLDFANTEEIPVFLRNWNVNKKRRFKPKISNCSPAKRQRRSGPDSHNHSDSINRL